MSDANLAKTSEQVLPKAGGAHPTPSSAHERTPPADGVDAALAAPVLAIFAPLPSVHGVTYSMI